MPKALSIDKPVDGNLKPVKDSDGTMTALELSTDTVRVKDLVVSGTAYIPTGIAHTDNSKLPLAGGTMSGDVHLQDSVKAIFNSEGNTSYAQYIKSDGYGLEIVSDTQLDVNVSDDIYISTGSATITGTGSITLYTNGNAKLLEVGDGTFDPSHDADIATKKYVDDNAGGGGAFFMQMSGRGRCQNNNWYYCTHTMYGGNYYYWFYSNYVTSLPTVYYDSYNPSYLVPKTGTITGYSFVGNISSVDTIECAMLKGAQPTYGSAGNYTLSQVGATQSTGGTANILYKWEQTGLSVAVAKNDIIMPMFRRTTDNDSSYVYFEVAINVIIE